MADDRVMSRTFSCESLTKYGWYEAGYGVSLMFSFILLLKSRVTVDTPGASGRVGGTACRMGCWLLKLPGGLSYRGDGAGPLLKGGLRSDGG